MSGILSSKEADYNDYNLYSFLARLPLHIFWRKMMMPGINCDRAFSSSNKVDGDLSRFVLEISSLSSSVLLPDKDLCLAKGDIFEELPVLKQHPVHHLI